MTLTVVPHPDSQNKQQLLDMLDQLKADVQSGEIIGFAAATLTDSDEVRAVIGTVKHVTRLRVYGAASHLLHCLHAGEV